MNRWELLHRTLKDDSTSQICDTSKPQSTITNYYLLGELEDILNCKQFFTVLELESSRSGARSQDLSLVRAVFPWGLFYKGFTFIT